MEKEKSFLTVLNKILILLDKSRGRDKCYRLTQNLCRITRFIILGLFPKFPLPWMVKILILERNMSRIRKMIRIGSPLIEIMNLKKSFSIEDFLLRFLFFFKSFSYLGYILSDHVYLMVDLKLISVTKMSALRLWITRFSFWSTLFDLFLQIYNLQKLNQEEEELAKEKTETLLSSAASHTTNTLATSSSGLSRRQILHAKILKASIDLPPNILSLMYGTVNLGVLGLCGFVTSSIGVYLNWPHD